MSCAGPPGPRWAPRSAPHRVTSRCGHAPALRPRACPRHGTARDRDATDAAKCAVEGGPCLGRACGWLHQLDGRASAGRAGAGALRMLERTDGQQAAACRQQHQAPGTRHPAPGTRREWCGSRQDEIRQTRRQTRLRPWTHRPGRALDRRTPEYSSRLVSCLVSSSRRVEQAATTGPLAHSSSSSSRCSAAGACFSHGAHACFSHGAHACFSHGAHAASRPTSHPSHVCSPGLVAGLAASGARGSPLAPADTAPPSAPTADSPAIRGRPSQSVRQGLAQAGPSQSVRADVRPHAPAWASLPAACSPRAGGARGAGAPWGRRPTGARRPTSDPHAPRHLPRARSTALHRKAES